MHTEAYTWMTTLAVAFSAAGGALAGLLVDHAAGVRLGVRDRGPRRRAGRRAHGTFSPSPAQVPINIAIATPEPIAH